MRRKIAPAGASGKPHANAPKMRAGVAGGAWLEQYPIGSNRIGSIRSDKIARHFKKIEHLYPINWIA
jgi:hypothetical protein